MKAHLVCLKDLDRDRVPGFLVLGRPDIAEVAGADDLEQLRTRDNIPGSRRMDFIQLPYSERRSFSTA